MAKVGLKNNFVWAEGKIDEREDRDDQDHGEKEVKCAFGAESFKNVGAAYKSKVSN